MLDRSTAVTTGFVIAGFAFIMAAAIGFIPIGADARSYFSVDSQRPYEHGGLGTLDAYLYSPAFMQLTVLIRGLGAQGFFALLSATSFLAVLSVARGYSLLWMLTPWVILELWMGNIHLLLAASVVIGMRHPYVWAFVLLTKVTPGVAMLWFVVRRDWRALALAATSTAAVVAVSAAVEREAWLEWLALLVRSGDDMPEMAVQIPLPARLLVAAGIVIWGARTDRPQTVPIGPLVALPVVWGHSFAMIVAALPLVDWRAYRARVEQAVMQLRSLRH